MHVRREAKGDEAAIHAVHRSAFPSAEEADLVDALRRDETWIAPLSIVATVDDQIVGHALGTRARVGVTPVVALAPIGVMVGRQGSRLGSSMMYAFVGAADALDFPLIVVLGEPAYYSRFGFIPAAELDITAPVAGWEPYFQVLPLATYSPGLVGVVTYPGPFKIPAG